MIRTTRFLAVVLLGFAAASAQANVIQDVINVQFGTPATPLYVGTAAGPAGGTVWNEFTGSGSTNATVGPGSSLVDSFGNPTTVNYTIGAVGGGANSIQFYDIGATAAGFSGTGETALSGGQISAVSTETAKIVISGLSAGNPYALYFYSERGQAGYATDFTVTDAHGSQTGTAGPNVASSGFNDPDNYVTFGTGVGLTPLSNQLTITFTYDAAVGGPYGATNGFQIVEFTPEPASVALMGIGFVGMLWVVRRRRGERVTIQTIRVLAVVGLGFAAASAAQAGSFSTGFVTGPSNVQQGSGTLWLAEDSGGAAVTIGTAAFANGNPSYFTGSAETGGPAFPGGSPTFTNPGLETLMSSYIYNGGATLSATLPVTSGGTYNLELLFFDPVPSRMMYVTATQGLVTDTSALFSTAVANSATAVKEDYSFTATGSSIGVTVNFGTSTPFLSGFSLLGAAPVPEPASVVLFGLGAIGLFAIARRQRRACVRQAARVSFVEG